VARISEHARVCVTRCAMSPGHEARVTAMHKLCDKIDPLSTTRASARRPELALNRRGFNQPSDSVPLFGVVFCRNDR